ncbi:MAG: DUF1080 domain-containing protein [Candidatus Bathyarchaeota archaeon]|nr:DUF1080 domain-containing protein [Candidatus Bathyarchaeota archaeon]
MVIGRWDVTIHGHQGPYAAWFEITQVNGKLGGRYVGIEGSARPIETIHYEAQELSFQLPPQYEKHKGNLIFTGTVRENSIIGTTNDAHDNWVSFHAEPAPRLEYQRPIEWGEPINLINSDLSNWFLRNPSGPDGWRLQNGVLINTPPSGDLITKQKYTNFTLHAEFKIPDSGNSGIYLRGRYEMQIVDDHQREPGLRTSGSIYGFIAPTVKATKPVDNWNSCDITLIGRYITITYNGKIIIEEQEIPGLTGGALDSCEGDPGPIMLQGDHKAVQYRNLQLTPIRCVSRLSESVRDE